MRVFSGYNLLPEFVGYPTGNVFAMAKPPNQLIAQAQQIQTQYGPVFREPEGASALAAATALENAISAAWNDFVSAAQQRAAIGPPPPPPEQNFPTAQQYWDAEKAWLAQNASWNAQTVALTDRMNNSLAPMLVSKLTEYTTRIPKLAADVQALIDARIKQKTAEIQLQTAKATEATVGTSASTFVAEQKLDQAKVEVALAKAAVSDGASALKSFAGVPLWALIAGGGVILLGGAVLLFGRKSGGAVAGYRRSKRRRVRR